METQTTHTKEDIYVDTLYGFHVQILTLFDGLDSIDTEAVVRWVKSLQQSDGSFYGDKWGE